MFTYQDNLLTYKPINLMKKWTYFFVDRLFILPSMYTLMPRAEPAYMRHCAVNMSTES